MEQGDSPIATAYKNGLKGLVKFLYDHGARFLHTDVRVLRDAIFNQRIESIRELLEYGIEPDVHGDYIFPMEVRLL
jgi:hypothetical protein